MSQKIDVRLNVDLHENQKIIHHCPKRIRVVNAGKRFGKSNLAQFTVTQWAADKKGLYWYVAPTYGMAKSIAWIGLLTLIPDGLIKRKNINELEIVLTNGSIIQLKGADNVDSLRGPEIDGCVLDEAAYLNPAVWPNIVSGQMTKSLGPVLMISSPINPYTNPNAVDWYTDFWNYARERELAGDPDYATFYFTFLDNPTLTDKAKEEQKRICTDETWNLEYLAIKSALTGRMFHEFNYEKNVGTLGDDKDFKLFRFHDWGTDHPTVCLWAKMKAELLPVYITDEWVKSDFTIRENCETIIAKTAGQKVDWDVIDPSANKRLPDSLRTIINEYQRCGIGALPGDRGARGIDIVKQFLKFGYVKIDPRCKNLIHELQDLQWGQKTKDDCTDSLRYGLVRIHDLIFKGKTFETERELWQGLPRGVYSLYDRNMFGGKKKTEGYDFLIDEARAV